MFTSDILDLVLQRLIQAVAVSCLLAGLFFLMWPVHWTKTANSYLSKWVTMRSLTDQLETYRSIDTHVMKIHKLLGVVALVLTILLTYLYLQQ